MVMPTLGPTLGGRYALDVLSETVWFVGAAYQEGTQFWTTRTRVEVPPGGTTLDLELRGPYPLPAPLTVSLTPARSSTWSWPTGRASLSLRGPCRSAVR